MNWFPCILVVAMGYEVQGQAYSDRRDRGDGHQRGINSLFFAFRFSISELGQNIQRNECQTFILLALLEPNFEIGYQNIFLRSKLGPNIYT